MRRTAPKYGLACLLHEKPFAGVNGSGKHLNWSMSDDEGHNLLSPGANPHDNLQFLVFCTAVLRAVNKWQGLLRASIASAGNDHRLGANEAPPAILSVFLGDMLTDIFEQIEKGGAKSTKHGGMLDTGVMVLPKLPRDAGDRNRTSPFAFTGNKFEFRAVSSNQSIAYPNIALNVAVTESLDYMATELEKAVKGGKTLEQAVGRAAAEGDQGEQADHLQRQQLLEGVGEGSGQARAAEPEEHGRRAAAAGHQGGRSALFEKYKVLNERELHARYEIMVETYNKTVNVEGQLMVLMANRYILPAALEYQKQVAQSVAAVKAAGGKSAEGKKLLDQVTKLTDELKRRTDKLQKALDHEGNGVGRKARQALPRRGHPGDGGAARDRRCARDASSRTNCGRSPPIARCCSSSSEHRVRLGHGQRVIGTVRSRFQSAIGRGSERNGDARCVTSMIRQTRDCAVDLRPASAQTAVGVRSNRAHAARAALSARDERSGMPDGRPTRPLVTDHRRTIVAKRKKRLRPDRCSTTSTPTDAKQRRPRGRDPLVARWAATAPGIDRQRRAPRGGAVAVPQLRAVGHHRARAARRARRPEAGAAPHPLHDVAAEPDRRRQAPQVRQGRRRRDGQLPPARRRGALRDAGAHGAAVFAALSAGRRLGQLRLARRRQRGGDALHRVPARAHQRRDADRDRAGDRATSGRTTTARRPSRSSCRRASRTCWSTAPPASPSAWRPTSRRTTSARCARRSSSCSTTRTSATRSCAATSRGRTSRPAARSSTRRRS